MKRNDVWGKGRMCGGRGGTGRDGEGRGGTGRDGEGRGEGIDMLVGQDR